MRNSFLRPAKLAPFGFTAASVILGSYAVATYADAKKRRNIREQFFSHWDTTIRKPVIASKDFTLKREWRKLSESQQTIYSIIAANATVFLLWRVPACSNILNRYFLHAIDSSPLSMLGSIFSHRSLTHFGFNMFALNSFGGLLHEKMGREQFCAFYLSSGAASSFGSHLFKCYRLNFTPSLGASGAIFGVVGACGHFPNLKVSLIILPIHSVPMSTALPVLMGIDFVGMVQNWALFDHAAHFAGASFGYLAFPYSEKLWSNRKNIISRIFGP